MALMGPGSQLGDDDKQKDDMGNRPFFWLGQTKKQMVLPKKKLVQLKEHRSSLQVAPDGTPDLSWVITFWHLYGKPKGQKVDPLSSERRAKA